MTNDDRNLPARGDEPRRSVELHDNGLRAGNLIDGAISRLDENQVKALGLKAAEAALELQKRQTQQNIDYVTGKKVAEDHVEMWDTLNKNGHTTRQKLTTDIETGAGRMRIESKSGATCFVATAAYGDWRHPDVEFLRWYRDNVLVTSPAGRVFTRVYWKVGPLLATLVGPYPKARAAARAILSRLVAALRKKVRTQRLMSATLCCLSVGLACASVGGYMAEQVRYMGLGTKPASLSRRLTWTR